MLGDDAQAYFTLLEDEKNAQTVFAYFDNKNYVQIDFS